MSSKIHKIHTWGNGGKQNLFDICLIFVWYLLNICLRYSNICLIFVSGTPIFVWFYLIYVSGTPIFVWYLFNICLIFVSVTPIFVWYLFNICFRYSNICQPFNNNWVRFCCTTGKSLAWCTLGPKRVVFPYFHFRSKKVVLIDGRTRSIDV